MTPVREFMCPDCWHLTWWQYVNAWWTFMVMDVWAEQGFRE